MFNAIITDDGVFQDDTGFSDIVKKMITSPSVYIPLIILVLDAILLTSMIMRRKKNWAIIIFILVSALFAFAIISGLIKVS